MTEPPPLRKPPWLKVKIPTGGPYAETAKILRGHRLHTVCREARCPNAAGCWAAGTATIMILGDECTRACRFCAVGTRTEPPAPDSGEPARVAAALKQLALRYAVITSVTRDDLHDGGASHFAAVVRACRGASPGTRIELLIPDLRGDTAALDVIAGACPDVVGHNLETIRRLSREIRDPSTDYDLSLGVLEHLAQRGVETKSALLLGLGETDDEVTATLTDLRSVGVRHVALGQYLAPSAEHTPVKAYVPPEAFDCWRTRCREMGFTSVASGPLVRSSYMAAEIVGETLDSGH